MAEKVAIEFTIGDGPAIKSMGDLKRQLKEANFEALKMSELFGAASEQAIAASKKVGQLKDAIGDAKDLTDAFNPDAKFKALGGAIQGVAGGFAAVQGAMALFGAESEDVQKTLAKVQGALALSQGLDSIMQAKDAFKNLKAVAVDTFNSLKGAISATGIGLLVVGVGLLVANFDKLKSMLYGVSDAQEQLNAGIEAYTNGVKDATQKTNEVSQAFKKAEDGTISEDQALQIYNDTLGDSMGKTDDLKTAKKKLIDLGPSYIQMMAKEAQVQALIAEQAKLQTESLTAKYKDQTSTFDKFSVLASNYFENGIFGTQKLGSEIKKVQEDNIVALQKKNEAINQDIQNVINSTNTEIESIKKTTGLKSKEDLEYQKKKDERAKEAEKKAEEKRKKEQEQREKEKQEKLDAEKKLNDELEALKQENYLKSIKDEDERAQEKLRLDYINKKKEIEQSKASDESKNKLIAELTKQFFIDQNQINADAKAKKDEEADKAIQEEIDRLDKFNEDELKKKKDNIEAQKKLDEEKFNNQMELASKTSSILSQFADVVGKQTAVGKALAIASATIDTYQGAMKAFRATYSPIGPVDVAMRFASVAATIATGIKNVKAIASVKVPGGNGGSSSVPNTPSVSMGGGMEAPVAPALSSTALNQQMINNLNSATSRAFVLESDISGNQERIQRLNRAARIS